MALVLLVLYVLAALLALFLVVFALLAARDRRRPRTRRGPLKPLESALFEILVARSQPEVSRRLRRQLELFSRHCRLHFEKSMTLEVFSEGPEWSKLDDLDLAFPNKDELRLAELSFEARGHTFEAHFGAVNGRLFDMVVRPNPRRVLNTCEVVALHFKAGDDTMRVAEPVIDEAEETPQEFVGFVAEWEGRFGIADARPPLKAAAADRLLSRIDASLPADYMELTRQANGLSLGRWEILGLAKVHSVALGEHDDYVLASEGDCYLAVRRGARDGLLYSCSSASEESLPEGASFRDAIERDLREDAGDVNDR